MSKSVLISTLALLGLTVVSLDTHAAVGRTNGSFGVSSSGQATYSIPVWVPQGVRGIQPSLAITYNSASGNGIAGPGWSLSGLSQISRCNATWAQDSSPAAVTLTNADKFCVDGSRLRLTSGTYGTAGSTYQTEVADFSKITAYSSAGNGPAYFTLQAKNGLTYEYGNTADSRISPNPSVSTAHSWLLNKVSDRSGNSYVITYSTGAAGSVGIGVPQSISYSPTSPSASTYNYTVTFSYGTRVAQDPTTNDPAIVGYVGGVQVVNTNLLLAVNVSHNGTLVHRYSLSYSTAPTTARARLQSLTECAGSGGTDCLSPTTFAYQDGSSGLTTSPVSLVSGANVGGVSARDFTGDGRGDILYGDSASPTLKLAVSTGAGFAAPVSMPTSFDPNSTVAVGDVLGTGKADVLGSIGGVWWRYSWNGANFIGTSTGLSAPSNGIASLIDMDGDGLPELVTYTITFLPAGKYSFLITSRHNNSSGSTVSFGAETTVFYSPDWRCTGNRPCYPTQYTGANSTDSSIGRLDFNGDGRADIAISADYYDEDWGTLREVHFLTSNGSVFTDVGQTTSEPELFPNVTFANWNDDACTDTLFDTVISISSCAGQPATPVYIAGRIVSAIDWNHDGRMDALVQNGSNLAVFQSTGSGGGTLIPTSVPYREHTVVFDQNGDGLDDLISYYPSMDFFANNGANTPPDLLTSVTDGFGVSYSPSYTSIAIGTTYSKYLTATFPDVDFIGPLYVVSEFSASDGIGGTYTNQFKYYGARANLQGRGFQGFLSRTRIDSRTDLRVGTLYRADFPFNGAVIHEDLYRPSTPTQIVHRVLSSHTATTLDGTANNQRYFPHVDQTTEYVYEEGGIKNGQLISTAVTNFTFDSYGNQTNVASTTTDNDPTSPLTGQQWTTTTTATISPDTSNWCLGLPTSVSTANTAPGTTSLTRRTDMTPDYASCRITAKIVEPTSSLYSVTESYGFDSFGNTNSVTTTGSGMAARTTTVDWGTRGQFPISVTNALNEQTQAGYDFNLGVRTSLTDPNGISTSWQYDNFARQTRENRPDGTATDYVLTNYTASDPNLRTFVSVTARDTSNSAIATNFLYYDSYDRLARTTTQMLGGSYSITSRQFNNQGWVSQISIPYLSGTTPSAWTTYSYDALGRVTSESRPISASNPTLQSTTILYQGLTTVTTDPEGKQSTKITTAVGAPSRTQDHNGYYVDFSYDALGSLTLAKDSQLNVLSSASYVYGIGPFKTASTDMDLGSRGYAPNALGETTAYTDANGASFSMTYDKLSRPLTRSVAGEGTVTWTWGSSSANFNIGRLESIIQASGPTETNTYDNKGRLTRKRISSDATYDYDFAYQATTGMLDTLTYPTSTSAYRLKLEYGYQYGILKQVKDFNSSTIFWTLNSTNYRGQATQETLGNGLVTNRSFDAVTGWVDYIRCGITGGTCAQNQSYLFDKVGNMTQRQNNNLGLTENFYYDNLYRLDYSQLNGVTNLDLSYDAMGNITSRTDVAGNAAWTYHPTRKHQVTQAGSASFTYSYDANGNAIARNGQTITWNKFNYPTVISNGGGETASFFYDGNQSRWKQVYVNGGVTETTIYAGGLLEKVSTNGVDDYRYMISANGQTVAVMSRASSGTNSTRYLLHDALGSVAKITDSAGANVVSESFSAFGARRNPQTWSGGPTNGDLVASNGVTREGYTGHDAVGTMGLNHMNGRVQDSVTGRFLSADPYISSPGNTQGYNRYGYVMNNPLTYVDPSGFFSVTTLPPVVVRGIPLTNSFTDGNGSMLNGRSYGGWGINGPPSNFVMRHAPDDSSGDTIDSPPTEGDPITEVVVTGTKEKPPNYFDLRVLWTLVKDKLCEWPAATLTGEIQLDLAAGPFDYEGEGSMTFTTHGQVIFQAVGPTENKGLPLFGYSMAGMVSVSPQWGLQFQDTTPGTSAASTTTINFSEAWGLGGGGQFQFTPDSGQFDFTARSFRTGPAVTFGGGVLASAGQMDGKQWATKGFCGKK